MKRIPKELIRDMVKSEEFKTTGKIMQSIKEMTFSKTIDMFYCKIVLFLMPTDF